MATRMKGEDRRAAIVTAAIALFSEKGFRGTTTRELAAALGVSEPVLYQHFRTKSELYSAILEWKARQDDHKGQEIQELFESPDDRRFFTRIAEMILDKYEQDPGFMRLLLFSALDRHELSQMFYRSQIVSFYETVAGYIQRHIADNLYRAVDPEIAARDFIGAISYHGLGQLLFGMEGAGSIARQQFVEQSVDSFLEGLKIH